MATTNQVTIRVMRTSPGDSRDAVSILPAGSTSAPKVAAVPANHPAYVYDATAIVRVTIEGSGADITALGL